MMYRLNILKPRFWLMFLLTSLLASVAFAARTTNGLVLIAEGDREIQREITQAILRDMRSQPADELLDAIAAEGVTGSVSEALSNPRTRKKTIAAIQKAMRTAGAGAVLSVRAKRIKGGEKEMHVVLIVATQASPMIEEDFILAPGELATPQVVPLVAASLPELRSSSTAQAASPPAVLPAAPPAAQPAAPPAALPAAPPTALPAAPPATSAAPGAPANVAPTPANDESIAEKPAKRARKKAASEEPVEGAAPTDDEPSAEKPAKRARKKAASEEPVEDEPAPADQAPSAPERARGKAGKRDFTNAIAIIEGAFGIGRRQLQYSDPWAGNLRPYLAPGIGVYSLSAELYPGAASNMEVLKDVGVVARYTGSLSVESVTSDGQKVNGSFQRLAFGLRARIPTGDRKTRPLIGLEGTYGLWNYAFTGMDQAVDESPSVRYTFIRAGADARIPYGRFAVLAGAGYMNIGSAGPLSERFPRLTVSGIDAMGGATVTVAPPLELRLIITYSRFFSQANPEPGADYIAGGTLDQFVIATIGASTLF
jgi:hypothetical protein